MKQRIIIASVLAMFAMHGVADAGELSAGVFNSFKGFGLSLDYAPSTGILNSFMVYADTYRVFSGTYRDAGIKMVYLHYNRLKSFESDAASFDILLGPGASTGYVRDAGSELFGFILSADVAIALRARFQRNIDLELGAVAELGFISGDNGGKFQMSMYDNGLAQALLPFLKILVRF